MAPWLCCRVCFRPTDRENPSNGKNAIVLPEITLTEQGSKSSRSIDFVPNDASNDLTDVTLITGKDSTESIEEHGKTRESTSSDPISSNSNRDTNTKMQLFFETLDNPDKFRLSLSKLERKCPKSTEEERCRFLKARKEDYNGALDQLQSYLAWREEKKLDQATMITSNECDGEDWFSCSSFVSSEDELDWNEAVESAFVVCCTDTHLPPILPRLARLVINEETGENLLDENGFRILQLLPAQLDSRKASYEVYVTAISIYLDKKLCRRSLEKITVCVDVRAGHGWTNPPAGSIVPFIKMIISTLERNFPERLSRSILFPLPMAATSLWKFIKFFLDPSTANKVVVIGGSANKDSPLVTKRFEKYITADTLEIMEKNRASSFC